MGTQFVGHSMMVNPWGVIQTAGGDEEVILHAEVGLNELKSFRDRFPTVTDRLDWLNNNILP